MKRVSLKVAKAIKEAGYYFSTEVNEYFTKYFPTYLDVWLWLWREKEIRIEAKYHFDDNGECCWTNGYIDVDYTDPEEAIIAAIEHLVENDLIK